MRRFNSNIVRVKNNTTGEYEPLAALRGYSSYELAVANGFEGTEAEWMESIIGDGWIGAFQDLEEQTKILENELHSLTPSSIGAAVQAHYTTAIGTEWVGDTAPYTQEIAVPGILLSDNPIVDIIPSDTYSTAEQQIEEFNYIYRLTTKEDAIVVYAMEPTTVSIGIHMEVIR